MLSSMTGFGEGASIENNSEVYIEIKSVNHRFLEISIKPNDLNNDLDKAKNKAEKLVENFINNWKQSDVFLELLTLFIMDI